MYIEDARLGVKFVDPMMSQPEEYRVHQICFVGPADTFEDGEQVFEVRAVHIASRSERVWRLTPVALARLELIPTAPVLESDLGCLVGDVLDIELTMGSTVRGRCTGVRYADADVLGQSYRQLFQVELDNDPGSSYPLHEIVKIERI